MALQDLYNNDRESLLEIKNYITNFLKEFGIAKMFNGEDTQAVGEAKTILDEAFDNLDTLFAPKPKPKDRKNSAR